MKKIVTLICAAFVFTMMMAQMHNPMKFVGAAKMTVASQTFENPSDTILFAMKGMTAGDITIPELKGMATIPSFTIEELAFQMDEKHVVTFAEQEFSTTVTVDGETKTIQGSTKAGGYDMADNSLTLTVTFTYGKMPMPMTYEVKAYYLKSVTTPVDVVVGGSFSYTNASVTYEIRKYVEDEVSKLDVHIPAFELKDTQMGDLTLGTYTVCGLVFDADRGGYYRDYKDDGISFSFTAVRDGKVVFDDVYPFNPDKPNNILVKYDGNKVVDIINTFQMGTMPFDIVSKFGASAEGISLPVIVATPDGDAAVTYNLSGQRVQTSASGVVIRGSKKFINR